MRTSLLGVLLLASTLTGEALAQEHYTEGPVWQIEYYRLKEDKGDAYLKYLRSTWLPIAVELKKQGVTLDYKVFFNTGRRDPGDWDIAFASLFASYGKALDYSASDDEKLKATMAKLLKTKDEQKQLEAMAPRLDWREFVGQHHVREVTLRPIP